MYYLGIQREEEGKVKDMTSDLGKKLLEEGPTFRFDLECELERNLCLINPIFQPGAFLHHGQC